MSTKIYNGHAVMRSMSLSQAHALLHGFKAKVRKACKRLVLQQVGRMSCEIMDRRALGLPTPEADSKNSSALGFAAWEVHEGYAESLKKMTRSNYDYACSVTIFPAKGKTLLMLFSEKREYDKAFKSIPGVVEYPYWDNTDPPEGMSYEAWKRRGQDWDDALGYDEDPGDDHSPATQGLSIDCIGQFGLPLPIMEPEILAKQVLANLPKFEQRLIGMAHDAVFHARLTQVELGFAPRQVSCSRKGDEWEVSEAEPPRAGEVTSSEAMSIANWVDRSGESKELQQDVMGEIRGKLKESPTIEDLRHQPEKKLV